MTNFIVDVSGPPGDDLILTANGRDLYGWEEISVTLRAEGFPPSFEVGLSSLDPVSGTDAVVRPGDPCTVRLGRDTVITGYVDRLSNGGSAEGHMLRVIGRGKTQDLVDCSAEWDGGQIMAATAFDIAAKLAKPYGIVAKLAPGANAGPLVPQFNLTYGETAADIIQRTARNAALLAYEDPSGALVLVSVGKTSAASGIVYGENVEAWAVDLSMDGRFSEIVCTQLSQDILGDLGNGGFFFDTEKDPNVPRHRRLYIVLEQAADPQAFTIQKAKWEVARRAGRACVVTVTVDSWRDKADALWSPNTLVPVSLPGLPSSLSPLCVSEVTFRRDGGGTHADLVLLPKQAFAPEPISLLPLNLADVRGAAQ